MFEEAANISPKEIKAYRNFALPAALSDPTNDPFFSVENATTWITSLGFQLYLLRGDTVVFTSLYNPEDASTKELRDYRSSFEPRDVAATQNHPDWDSFPRPAVHRLRCGPSCKASPAHVVLNWADRSRIGEISARVKNSRVAQNGKWWKMIGEAVKVYHVRTTDKGVYKNRCEKKAHEATETTELGCRQVTGLKSSQRGGEGGDSELPHWVVELEH
ncbi:hypothetical protein B0H13DRAFT_1874864 [Mycena leptocephala]|nr:hypothetical protein B0H13DRAFT_1874864 [Mycena leptocephala]